MKKIIVLFFGIVLMVVISACGVRRKNEDKKEYTGILTDNLNIKPKVKYNLPKMAATVLEGYKRLDADALAPFLSDSEYEKVKVVFSFIKNSPEDRAFWDNTVGNVIYLEGYDLLLVKSIKCIEAKWYTDVWMNNEIIPANASKDFPVEYLDAIYDKYYDAAPYEISYNTARYMFYWDNDDSLSIALDTIPIFLGCERLQYLFTNYEYYTPSALRSAILLNSTENYSLGFDYIANDIPLYEDLLSKDLDKFMEIVSDIEQEEEKGYYYHIYENYYKNEQNRALLQKFINEECEVLRNVSDVVICLPVDVYTVDPYNYFIKDEGKKALSQMDKRMITFLHISEASDYYDIFSEYVELLYRAFDMGIVEEIPYS